MATDLEQIKGFLDEDDLRYAVQDGQETVYVPFGACTVRVFIVENGEGITFQAPQVFNLSESLYREKALEWMAHHVYETKIGHFGYDPRDGEVDVSHFQPIEDGDLTKTCFMRCLHVVRQVASEDIKALRRVAFTGVEPDDDEEGGGEAPAGEAPSTAPAAEPTSSDTLPEVDTANWPEPPMPERAWLKLLYGAFRSQLSGEPDAARAARLRGELWEQLVAARRQSTAADLSYATDRLADLHALDSPSEFALSYAAYLATTGQTAPTAEELNVLFGPQPAATDTAVWAKLVDLGLLSREESDGSAHYRLTADAAEAYGLAV